VLNPNKHFLDPNPNPKNIFSDPQHCSPGTQVASAFAAFICCALFFQACLWEIQRRGTGANPIFDTPHQVPCNEFALFGVRMRLQYLQYTGTFHIMMVMHALYR
jgi:hypothetical protein